MKPAAPLADVLMGRGLRVLNRVSALPVIDRLGLRKPAERLLFNTSKNAFRVAGAAGRQFAATQKLLKPSRLPKAPSRDLFDLTPSEEQQMLRDAVLGFASEQLRPAAVAADAACKAPRELLTQAAELGIAMMGIPEDLGGVGAERSAVTNVLVAEALAQGDLGLAVACLAPSAVSTALVLWGNETQQAKYLPAFTGESLPAAALAIQEPRALFNPFALKSVAKPVANGYLLSGEKSLVPLAADAELFIVAADLEGHGPALFVVEAGSAGISVEAEPAMGLRAAGTGRVRFTDVSLPDEALLAAGDASAYADCIQLARIGWCALAVGASQAALDYLIPYVNERVAFGEPISHRQSVAFNIANIGIELEGMRLATYRAAARAEQGLDFAREAAIARKLCSDKAMTIGSDAVQLLGGHGFVKEHPAERWYRDLRAVGVMEGVVLV